MLLPDCKFSQHLLPFKDPSCLVNAGDLTDEQVVTMHEQDGANSCMDPETDSDFLSQQPSQPTLGTGEHQVPHETDTGTGEASSTGELLQQDGCTATGEQDSPAQQQQSA
eukprot:844474-Rhodomonas_salina.4